MTRFLDGPAMGQTLMLIRTPIFLRVTQRTDIKLDKWDALNMPSDKALPEERLYAYLLVEHHGHAFIDGTHCRGHFPMVAYAYIEAQPVDAMMRDNDAWARWTELAATLKQNIDRSTFIPKGAPQ